MEAFTCRLVRSIAQRAGGGDTDVLGALDAVGAAVDDWMASAVMMLRAEPWSYSWTDIGNALGVTKQAAQQRFGGPYAPTGE